MNETLLIATLAAVAVHLGTSVAGLFLRDNTDQKKLAAIDAKTDTLVATVAAIAPAVPSAAPKTLPQLAGDLAGIANALNALGPAPSPTPATGGTQ